MSPCQLFSFLLQVFALSFPVLQILLTCPSTSSSLRATRAPPCIATILVASSRPGRACNPGPVPVLTVKRRIHCSNRARKIQRAQGRNLNPSGPALEQDAREASRQYYQPIRTQKQKHRDDEAKVWKKIAKYAKLVGLAQGFRKSLYWHDMMEQVAGEKDMSERKCWQFFPTLSGRNRSG